jgi:hypothetical protein
VAVAADAITHAVLARIARVPSGAGALFVAVAGAMPAVVARARVGGAGGPRPTAIAGARPAVSAGATMFTVAVTRAVLCVNTTERYCHD